MWWFWFVLIMGGAIFMWLVWMWLGTKPPRHTKPDDLVCVFKGPQQEADLVKGMLISAGIDAFLENENIATTYGPITGAVGYEGGRVVVAEHDEAKAEELIAAARVSD